MTPGAYRLAGAPISWGVCEVAGWGHQMAAERVLAEMREAGLAATELEVSFSSPHDALEHGIATVYQDLAMIPLLSISRNFFLGAEPTRWVWPFRRYDARRADEVVRRELAELSHELQQQVGAR